jgi:hypothetical protein
VGSVAAFSLRDALRELFESWPNDAREKNYSVWQGAYMLTADPNLSRGSGGGFFTKLMMTD